jgi:hypothetical protein
LATGFRSGRGSGKSWLIGGDVRAAECSDELVKSAENREPAVETR